MHTPAMMVEVFKTNVQDSEQAERVVRGLRKHYPDCRVTFDLEDCDRILRVQSIGANLPVLGILRRVNAMGYQAAVLPDELPADTAVHLTGVNTR